MLTNYHFVLQAKGRQIYKHCKFWFIFIFLSTGCSLLLGHFAGASAISQSGIVGVFTSILFQLFNIDQVQGSQSKNQSHSAG